MLRALRLGQVTVKELRPGLDILTHEISDFFPGSGPDIMEEPGFIPGDSEIVYSIVYAQ